MFLNLLEVGYIFGDLFVGMFDYIIVEIRGVKMVLNRFVFVSVIDFKIIFVIFYDLEVSNYVIFKLIMFVLF